MTYDVYESQVGAAVGLTTGAFEEELTLDFVPQQFTKFIIMGYAHGTPYGLAGALLVDGVTQAQVDCGNNFCPVVGHTGAVGVTTSVSLKLKQGTTNGTAAHNVRLVALGFETWYELKHEDESLELLGRETTQSKVLLQQFEHIPEGTYLSFSYSEYNAGYENNTTYGQIVLELNDTSELLETTLGIANAYSFSAGATFSNEWACSGSVGPTEIHSTPTNRRFTATKLSGGSTQIKYRRLRNYLIPTSDPALGVLQTISVEGPDNLTYLDANDVSIGGAAVLPDIEVDRTLLGKPYTSTNYKYVVLGTLNARAECDGTSKTVKTIFGYNGIGVTTDSEYFTGAGYGIDYSTRVSTYDAGDVLKSVAYKYGADTGPRSVEHFGFLVGTTTGTNVEDTAIAYTLPYGLNGDGVVSLNRKTFTVLQFPGLTTELVTGSSTDDPTVSFATRTLVEIYNTFSVNRFCLEQDTYLFDGLTSLGIAALISSGGIERDTVRDLLVTGDQVLEASDSGNSSEVLNLLDLESGLPAGISTSTTTEYNTFSHIHKLYASGLVDSIELEEASTDDFYGIIDADSVKVTFGVNIATTIGTIESIQGRHIKIREYDPVNQELRTIFSGKISKAEIGEDVAVESESLTGDVIESVIPEAYTVDNVVSLRSPTSTKVSGKASGGGGPTGNIGGAINGITLDVLASQDPAVMVPIFFGKAKRVPVPNKVNYYGSAGTDPAYLDAYAEYLVGGPALSCVGRGLNGTYNVVITDPDDAGEVGVLRDWIGITSTEEFDEDEYIISNDHFSHKGANLASLRFAAASITTETRTSLLPLPHFGSVDDISLTYPALTPIVDVYALPSYRRGKDYVFRTDTPDDIKWNGGGNNPTASVTTSVVADITRIGLENTTDNINAYDATEALYPVISLTGVTQSTSDGVVTYTEGQHFSVSSSSSLRTLDDIIDWSPIAGLQARWLFSQTLIDTESSYTLSPGVTTELMYSEDGHGVEFVSGRTDFVLTLADGTISPSGSLDFKSASDLRVVCYVRPNRDGFISGGIVKKSTEVGHIGFPDGYEVGVTLESLLDGAGSTTKYVAYATIGDGVTYATIFLDPAASSDVSNLDVVSSHKIELRYDTTLGKTFLLHNNVIGASTSLTFSTTGGGADLTVGDGTSQFEGIIDELFITDDPYDQPYYGEDYTVAFDYLEDQYEMDWSYLVTTASNPIQVIGDQPVPIAVDAKVAGCDLTPTELTISVPTGISTANFTWTRSLTTLGYAIRLNYEGSDRAWTLGESGLGEDTILSSFGTDGRVEIDANASMELKGDFTLYAYAVWRGSSSSDGLLAAKEIAGDSSKVSYGIGVFNGYPYGAVYARGAGGTSTLYTVQGTRKLDSGLPVLITLIRRGSTLFLYVDDGIKIGATSVGRSTSAHYDAGKFVIGSSAIFSSRWIGDVAFVGLCDYAVPTGFMTMLMDCVRKGIKGAWSQQFAEATSSGNIRKRAGQTIFHLPFTEGTGTTIKSRNLHRNFALAVKRVLTDPVFGLRQAVDPFTFDDAITALDDLGLVCDFTMTEEAKVVDILNQLLIVRGMYLKRMASGTWGIYVDSLTTAPAATFGYGDGVYNNIIEVEAVSTVDASDRVKQLKFEYGVYPDATGSRTANSSIVRVSDAQGVETKTFTNNFILDDATADKVAAYLANKLAREKRYIEFSCGQEARWLAVGQVIKVSAPTLGVNNEYFKVVKIGRDSGTFTIKATKYTSKIYQYNAGPFPQAIDL